MWLIWRHPCNVSSPTVVSNIWRRCSSRIAVLVIGLLLPAFVTGLAFQSKKKKVLPPTTPTTAVGVVAPVLSNTNEYNNHDILQQLSSVLLESKNYLISAAVARGVSIAAFFPIDTYKTLVQIAGETATTATTTTTTTGSDMILATTTTTTTMGSLSNFILSGDVAILYAGLVPALVGQIPYGVLTFGGYEIYKKLLLRQQQQHQSWWLWRDNVLIIYIVAAVLGDLTGSLWLCPSEVIKQQLQSGRWPIEDVAPAVTDANAVHDNVALVLVASILNHDGLAGLYRGYASNVIRDVPFRVFQLSSYEVVKGYYLKSKQKADLSSFEAALIGGMAGMISAAITTPLDVIKSTMMTGSCSAGIDASWGGCLQGIYDTRGVEGLFAGIVPRIELIGLMSALFFVINESVLQLLAKRAREVQKV